MGDSFRCRKCGAGTRVSDTRSTASGIRRRRICLTAEAHRFTTYEAIKPEIETPLVSDEDLREVRMLLNRVIRRSTRRAPSGKEG